ncbi:hypothetical protein [Sulfolobus polyhedral virus 1]|uniref:Uncharacterized protein n=1 Tax=Sulfolobus polyhedral virus 1 TaxID=1982658 RepID=A0A1W6I152_SPV1|nr:hypothetical protein DT302_gp13 [Sulfolobus polyhedral virus 1]ARM37795.1 hypothetical protein [Sulfolobus polyhedral virus 1]
MEYYIITVSGTAKLLICPTVIIIITIPLCRDEDEGGLAVARVPLGLPEDRLSLTPLSGEWHARG